MARLYIVATPIGNLEDFSVRAVGILASVWRIFAEDTRVTRTLLERYNIQTAVVSYHQHSGVQKVDQVIGWLREGHDLALVSDAGTPGINDPGNVLIHEVLAALPETAVIPVPGANAAIAALSISGLPTDRFRYLGFPPHKKGRQTFFREIAGMSETVVFLESKHRIRKALESLRDLTKTGERQLVVARELTKQFETVYRGTVDHVLAHFAPDQERGEFVVVVGPIIKPKRAHEEEDEYEFHDEE